MEAGPTEVLVPVLEKPSAAPHPRGDDGEDEDVEHDLEGDLRVDVGALGEGPRRDRRGKLGAREQDNILDTVFVGHGVENVEVKAGADQPTDRFHGDAVAKGIDAKRTDHVLD